VPGVATTFTSGEVLYLDAGSPFGQPGVGATSLDGNASGFSWPSIASIEGLPAIAYFDVGAHLLRYIPALDDEGEVWGPMQTPVTPGPLGACASLAEVNGAPAIAYFDAAAARVRYVDSTLSGGTVTWNPAVTVGATGSAVFFDSLVALADGSPAVAWHDKVTDELLFARAPGPQGNAFNSPVLIVSTGGQAKLIPHLAMCGSLPHIAWFDPADDTIMEAHASNPAAAAGDWTTPMVVDDVADDNIIPALTTIGVHPGIAYAHAIPLELRFAVLY